MSLLINPDSPDFRSMLEKLQPTRGYCIFVDIVGSTEMKSAGIRAWIPLIHNTFANIRTFLTPFAPLKAIGDELMFFVADAVVQETGESALTFFSGLASIARDADRIFKSVKIAAAYCCDAYDITFVPGRSDIYGRDIDLTARLLTLASSREIIMNELFVRRVRDCYATAGNKQDFPEVGQIIGPWLERFKGVEGYTPVYRLPDVRNQDRDREQPAEFR